MDDTPDVVQGKSPRCRDLMEISNKIMRESISAGKNERNQVHDRSAETIAISTRFLASRSDCAVLSAVDALTGPDRQWRSSPQRHAFGRDRRKGAGFRRQAGGRPHAER